jgi:23S rRNA (cytosine1962-C5)-methyltransferase
MPNWRWLGETIAQLNKVRPATDQPLECLNLFAHTGGSTLAMATSDAAVTHVDAAKPSVTAARQVAAENRLYEARIRYLVEDAARYVAREVRRNRQYNVIVLDPPGYGHGTGGKTWRIGRDLWPLLDDCLRLLPTTGAAMLVTGHSESPDQNEIATYLRQRITAAGRATACATTSNGLRITSGRSELLDLSGRRLDAGYFVRAIW